MPGRRPGMTSRIGKGVRSNGSAGPSRDRGPPSAYLLDLRTFRVFLVLAAEALSAPGIKKSSCFLPPLIAAVSQRGLRPRPAQVSAGFSGLRYLGATGPNRRQPRPQEGGRRARGRAAKRQPSRKGGDHGRRYHHHDRRRHREGFPDAGAQDRLHGATARRSSSASSARARRRP
jgi:hypothetical protein